MSSPFVYSQRVEFRDTDAAGVVPVGTDLDRFVDRPDAVRALEGPILDAVVEAYRAAFSETFTLMLSVMTVALVVSRFMRDPEGQR